MPKNDPQYMYCCVIYLYHYLNIDIKSKSPCENELLEIANLLIDFKYNDNFRALDDIEQINLYKKNKYLILVDIIQKIKFKGGKTEFIKFVNEFDILYFIAIQKREKFIHYCIIYLYEYFSINIKLNPPSNQELIEIVKLIFIFIFEKNFTILNDVKQIKIWQAQKMYILVEIITKINSSGGIQAFKRFFDEYNSFIIINNKKNIININNNLKKK